MKKLLFAAALLLGAMSVNAQTAVNADGTLKYRGNVAILVEGRSFTFQNGQFVKQLNDGTLSELKNALRLLSMEKFQNMCFAVVNRDDEASKQVEQLISENKLEDYLDGFAVSAKNQGADYLFLVDITNYAENDAALQIEVDFRLMNVATNMGFHTFYRSGATTLQNESDMRDSAKKSVRELSETLDDFLVNIFPEQYYIAQANGKTWNLGAYQPNGRILPSDKFYAFRYKQETLQLGQQSAPIQVLEKVAICTSPAAAGGYLQVKSDKAIADASNIVLFRNVSQPVFQGVNQITTTFFGLNYDTDTYDGLIRQRINNAVFSAITRHTGLQLIEHDHLSNLKEERELQKSEDFIDGHVVEQMKAIGALYLMKLEDYERNESQVSLKLSLISVAANQIVRTVDITTSIDNIENEMYKQICDRIANPCVLKQIDKNTYEMTSVISLRERDNCILSLTKVVQNPATGEVSYSIADVCNMTVVSYSGNRCLLSVNNIISKEDMAVLAESSANGLVSFIIDGSNVKSDLNTKSDVKQTAEKAEKAEKRKSGFLNALKEAGKQAVGNMRINAE